MVDQTFGTTAGKSNYLIEYWHKKFELLSTIYSTKDISHLSDEIKNSTLG